MSLDTSKRCLDVNWVHVVFLYVKHVLRWRMSLLYQVYVGDSAVPAVGGVLFWTASLREIKVFSIKERSQTEVVFNVTETWRWFGSTLVLVRYQCNKKDQRCVSHGFIIHFISNKTVKTVESPPPCWLLWLLLLLF